MAQWDNILSRGRVEDRRGMVPVAGGISLTGLAIVLLLNYIAGGDMTDVIGQLNAIPVETQQVANADIFEGVDDYELFASTVLGSTTDTWADIFAKDNRTYTPPVLVLFRTATSSGCGTATSDAGPHYCPLDTTIYLDETFFDELQTRFGAQGGDVAEAYVVAHEVGHHVQHELNILDSVYRTQQSNPDGASDLSVKLELQADCFAGLWAHSIRESDVFLPGEIREALDAAAAVGDDRIQETVSGYVHPETWTHGSSEQRVSWFTKGYESGVLSHCDTFK